MKRQISSLFKSYVSTIFSIIVFTLTSIMLYKGVISMWPDAFIGYSLGSILLFYPRLFASIFSKWMGDKSPDKP